MIKNTDENISIPMVVDVPYRFAAGQYLGRALSELRDKGKFCAVRCPKCKRVQLPPRITCAVCLVKNEEWLELPMEGEIVMFTIMYLPMTDPTTGKPHNPPFVYGTVRFDGTDTVLDHFIKVEPDMDKIWVGMRCRVVMRPDGERIGDLSDIMYHEPLPGQVKPGMKA